MNKIFKISPITAVLIGAVFISFSGVWVKAAEVSSLNSAFYRVFFGFLFLLLPVLKNRDFPKVSKKRWGLLITCSFLFAIDLIFWHASINFIGPGLATILGNFQVFLLATIGVVFLGEAVRIRFLLAIPFAILGLFLIVGVNWAELGHDYKWGIYLGLGTAVWYSGFLIMLRKIQTDSGPLSFYHSLMFMSLGCSIFLAALMFIRGETFLIPTISSLLSLLALGLFSQTIGWLLITNAMPKIRASLTGLILLLQPTLSFVWDVLFFQRPTDLLNWFGVIITLVAIYLGLSAKK